MRKYVYISGLIALTLLIAVYVSCDRADSSLIIRTGETVTFTVGTSGSPADTRTAYSGVTAGGRERIDWKEGDMIRVYCAAASEPESKFADYVVNADVSASGAISISTIRQAGLDDRGLRWGDEAVQHDFYAVYPSQRTAGKSADEFGTAGHETIMTGNIPAEQRPLSVNSIAAMSEPHFTAVPDLTSLYMVARNSIRQSNTDAWNKVGGDGVFLSFKPVTTAIEFTIRNNFEGNGDLLIKDVQLISQSHSIAGQFTADLTGLATDGSKYPVCRSASAGNIVKIVFTSDIKVMKGQTLRFTFFLKPDYDNQTPARAIDVDDLTFRITKSDGSWLQTRLGYTDGSGIVFPCHRKSFVTGVLVPEGAQWTVRYSDDESTGTIVTPWQEGVKGNLQLLLDNHLLPGKFNVGTSAKPVYVHFTNGNLQACYNNGNPIWQFAEHQYTVIGSQDISKYKSNGWYDLFAWGATGQASSGHTPVPFWKYSSGSNGADDKNYRGDINTSSAKAALTKSDDWGANIISFIPGGTFITLTTTEWSNLLANHTHRKCTVAGVPGVAFLPGAGTLKSSYTAAAWTAAENAGALFLPSAGFRNGAKSSHSSTEYNPYFYYWSRSLSNIYGSNDETKPYYVPYGLADYGSLDAATVNWRQTGRAVRLVMKTGS